MMCSVRSIVACVVVVAAAAPGAHAQWWWWPPTEGWGVNPPCPHPSAPFDITLSGEWPDSCQPDASSVQVTGNRIDFTVESPGGICLPVITPWSRTETVGPLGAGVYEVYGIWIEAGVQQGPPLPLGTVEVSASCPAPCYPDCNESGNLTIADFTCFQARFVAGDPYADCNQSGALTIADFICFQAEYVAGCP